MRQKLGNTRTFVIGALASAVLSIPTLKVIELSKGNLAITIIGIVLGWSIAYNLIWAVISLYGLLTLKQKYVIQEFLLYIMCQVS